MNIIEYIKHIISEDAVAPNPTKVKAVKDWPVPIKNAMYIISLDLQTIITVLSKNMPRMQSP